MLDFIIFVLFVLVFVGLILFFIINQSNFPGFSGDEVNNSHRPTGFINTQAQPAPKDESKLTRDQYFHRKNIPKNYSYRLKNFLSPAERSFCGVLSRVVDGQNFIFAKVRIADILSPAMFKKNNRSEWQKAFNSISAKHFDFVICDLESIKVQYIIELDDSSHEKQKVKDQFKDAICKSAGLPLVRIKASNFYSTDSIKDQIENVINPSAFEITESPKINQYGIYD